MLKVLKLSILINLLFMQSLYAKNDALETIAIDEAISIVKENSIIERTDEEIIEGAIRGIVSSIDGYSDFFNPEEYRQVKSTIDGKFFGIGVEMIKEGRNLKVVSVINFSSASQAGILKDDIIEKIDDISTEKRTAAECQKQIFLSKKPIKLTIKRHSEDKLKTIELSVKTSNVSIPSVRTSFLSDYLVIKILVFNKETYRMIVNSVRLIDKKRKMNSTKGIILDLRDNPGGLLDQAIKVSSMFLDQGKKITTVKVKKENKEVDFKSDEEFKLLKDIPLVVLVNKNSASASEIVASAIKENNVGIVLGEKTFGKGTVQEFYEMFNIRGSALKLTFGMYYTPQDNKIEGNGVTPDVLIDKNEHEKVNWISEAIKYLNSKDYEQRKANLEKQEQIQNDSITKLPDTINTSKILAYNRPYEHKKKKSVLS